MDGRTVRGNQKEQIFGIGTSCIHGRFVQGEIWCKILRVDMAGNTLYVTLQDTISSSCLFYVLPTEGKRRVL